jgi:glycogen synthase
MDVLLLTNEFPPDVYGGAGVHVDALTRALRGQVSLDIRTFGGQMVREEGWRITGFAEPAGLQSTPSGLRPVLGAFARCLAMAADPAGADVAHCHTWYTHLAGSLLRARGVPLVVTAHSLEPRRPWKRDQLGAGYELAAAVERQALETADAVIAVSTAMATDIRATFAVAPERIHVIPNGIDPEAFAPTAESDELLAREIDPTRPYVLFVGRLTEQKGITHFLAALEQMDPKVPVVLAAGQADTPQLAAGVETAVNAARTRRAAPVVWLSGMLDRRTLVQLYSHAALFVCPSIYEPFGITNLEAMACGIPVVASGIGGIPEVVVDGQTGFLVDLPATDGPMTPDGAAEFASGLAAVINRVLEDPGRAAEMGAAGRRRVVEHFGWPAIAARTLEVYRSVTIG